MIFCKVGSFSRDRDTHAWRLGESAKGRSADCDEAPRMRGAVPGMALPRRFHSPGKSPGNACADSRFLRSMKTTFLLAAALASSSGITARAATFSTATAAFEVDDAGAIKSIRVGDHERLAPGNPSPLLQICVDGKWIAPTKAVWNAAGNECTLRYGDAGVTVVVRAEAKPTHLTLEIVSVSPREKVSCVAWGPYPTTVSGIIGEVVGVVRDGDGTGDAVGIQALNPKTIGAGPDDDNDMGDKAAQPAPFGSVLQAHCRDRSKPRILKNYWGQPEYVSPVFNDGGVIGSRIALFAGPSAKALETIGAIEVAEGLPHPMLDDTWAKVAPRANAAYLIVDFDERNVGDAVAFAKRAGLGCVYHGGPFTTWGHFELNKRKFPRGWESFKACADAAAKEGVTLGFHTLSNFITRNDAYVAPKPDARLAQVGASALAADLAADAKEIPVAAPEFFRKKTCLNAVRIGEELVRYEGVTDTAPWRLTGCERGAYGTKAASHANGAAVAKLADHDYKVFLTDAELSQEVGKQVAEFSNRTGAARVSMDGLEGNFSAGLGDYGRTLFAKAWYDGIAPEKRGRVIADASNSGHYLWHLHWYYNWGEPWYAGFRDSQTEQRFKNQAFYTRNMLPHMMGWFSLSAKTTVADIEWMLARCAGYDAGFALSTNAAFVANQVAARESSTPQAKRMGEILDAIRVWEGARLSGAFSAEQKAALRDNTREFHLEQTGPGEWMLYPLIKDTRGPGERIVAARRPE